MISLLKLGSTIKKGERIRKLSEAKEEGIGLDAYSLFIFAIKSPLQGKNISEDSSDSWNLQG
jgi:hypothetical protein